MRSMQMALETMDVQSRHDEFDWSDYDVAHEVFSQAVNHLNESHHRHVELMRSYDALSAMEGLSASDREFMTITGLLETHVAVECLDSDTRRTVAMESIAGLVNTVLEQIKKFFGWLMETSKKLYNQLLEGLYRIERESRKIGVPLPRAFPLSAMASVSMVKHLAINGKIQLDKMPLSDTTTMQVLESATHYDQQLVVAITSETFERSPEDVASDIVTAYYEMVSGGLVGDICGDIKLERTPKGVSLAFGTPSPEKSEVICTNANDWNDLTNISYIIKQIVASRKVAETNNKKLKSLLDVVATSNPELASKQLVLIAKVVSFREQTVAAISNNMVSVLRYRLELAKSLTSASNGSKKPN